MQVNREWAASLLDKTHAMDTGGQFPNYPELRKSREIVAEWLDTDFDEKVSFGALRLSKALSYLKACTK